MRLLLPGSGWVLVEQVFLYPEEKVQEIATLRAQAARSLGGSGLSAGVIGAPSVTLAAEAAALSMVAGFLKNVAAKQALEAIKMANEKLFDLLTNGGVPHAPMLISGSHLPDPSTWVAEAGKRRFVHSGTEYIRANCDLGLMDIRWTTVSAWLR
ncbi:hypothetical protein [Enterovirga rhinocerotis]|uniref:Uncharacterized protein n=1 Tax=Enterovirga rhinocerotis TaxID=1339210 RepID=A0A4V3DXW2_9HYPH|nr:hypothetical protein [Enterovirga rhinocerotis]TDR90329.1 hypothetical protein EV668_3178 [Enterovirga rhinocerotis]